MFQFFYIVLRRDHFEISYYENDKFYYPLVTEELVSEYKKFELQEKSLEEAINFYSSYISKLTDEIKLIEKINFNDLILTLPAIKTGYFNLLSGVNQKLEEHSLRLVRAITPTSALALAKVHDLRSKFKYADLNFLSIVYDKDTIELGVYEYSEETYLISGIKIVIPNIYDPNIVNDYLNFVVSKIEFLNIDIHEIVTCGEDQYNSNFQFQISELLRKSTIKNSSYEWPNIMEGLMVQGKIFQRDVEGSVFFIDSIVNSYNLIINHGEVYPLVEYGTMFPKMFSLDGDKTFSDENKIYLVEINHRFSHTICSLQGSTDIDEFKVNIDPNGFLTIRTNIFNARLSGTFLEKY